MFALQNMAVPSLMGGSPIQVQGISVARRQLLPHAPAEKSVNESTWGEGPQLSYAFPADSFWRGHAKVSGKLPYFFLV